MKPSQDSPRKITALKVYQWLQEWEKVAFDDKMRRRRPDQNFYLFTLPAHELKSLSGIYRRTTEGGLPRSQDLAIQRRHDEERSVRIKEFIRYGYPWSELSEARRKSGQFDELLKPGWLPTAIVINILKSGDKRHGRAVAEKDIIKIDPLDQKSALICLPKNFHGSSWNPSELHPVEVIDGQHRLWAFEEDSIKGNFELPVVAFHGLDISWQAYLFWTINITPKRINASLAFDLYPLLRTEDWLEKFEGHSIYRETRAQELVASLWAHPESPWYQRINMLGEPGLQEKMVTQAAWVRSLMATYVKAWEGKRVSIGGLFGSQMGSDREVLPWSRAQQAAFLILMGQTIRDAVNNCKEPWTKTLRPTKAHDQAKKREDPAFAGPFTLLNADQGIRAILFITNDLCYVHAQKLHLEDWAKEVDAGASDEKAVAKALKSLKEEQVAKFLGNIAESLAKYDWRTSSAPGLTEEQQTLKAALRGSGGYRELRRLLLRHLSQEPGDVGKAAKDVFQLLGY